MTSFVKSPKNLSNLLLDDAKIKTEIPSKPINSENGDNTGCLSGLPSSKTARDMQTYSPINNNEIILLSIESVFDVNKNKSSSRILSAQVQS